MKKSLVSVVVPAFNAEKSLRRCLDSILAQSHSPIELILVNDGSQDRTGAIAAEYAHRILYLEQPNQGETAARNRGFSAASGHYISFLDHDDYWEPTFVEETVRFLEAHPETIGVSVGVEHRNALKSASSIRPTFLTHTKAPKAQPCVPPSFFDFWAEHDHICAGSAMMRTQVVRASGGQRTDLVLSGDMEFWAYLATFGKWGFIPCILLHVDGTQVAGGNLYEKFYSRYARCCAIDSWARRIEPRLLQSDRPGFDHILARVAGGYLFAHVFVGRDAEAYHTAKRFRGKLEGRFGKFWLLASLGGWPAWKLACGLVRARTKAQYRSAERRMKSPAINLDTTVPSV